MGIEEILKLFDMLELDKKVVVSDDYAPFIEFCYLLALMLKVDTKQIEGYFSE